MAHGVCELTFTEIFEELDKASGSSCESLADKLLSVVTSVPTAFITKPTSDLEQVQYNGLDCDTPLII